MEFGHHIPRVDRYDFSKSSSMFFRIYIEFSGLLQMQKAVSAYLYSEQILPH